MDNTRAFVYLKYCLYVILFVVMFLWLQVGLPVLILLIIMYERKDSFLKYFNNKEYKGTLKITDTDIVEKLNFKLKQLNSIQKSDLKLVNKRVEATKELLHKKNGRILDNIGNAENEIVLRDMEKKGYLKEYRNKLNDSLFSMYFIPIYGFLKLSNKTNGLRSKYCYVLMFIEVLLWLDIIYITSTLEGATKLIALIVSGTLLFMFYLLTRLILVGAYLEKEQEKKLEGYLKQIGEIYVILEKRLVKEYDKQQEDKNITKEEIDIFIDLMDIN